MRNKRIIDLTVKDAVVLALFWQHLLRPMALKADHAIADKLANSKLFKKVEERVSLIDEKKNKDQNLNSHDEVE